MRPDDTGYSGVARCVVSAVTATESTVWSGWTTAQGG